MTRNQIEYQKLQETKRANLQQEILTSSRDTRTNDLRALELNETRQHNRVVEDQALQDLGIKRMSAEANVSNAETNRINAETNQRNAQTNERNALSNYMQAQASLRSAAANALSAEASMKRASIEEISQVEQVRHNLESERQASRSNNIRLLENATERKKLTETSRMNDSTIALNETREFNLGRQSDLYSQQAKESESRQKATEVETSFKEKYNPLKLREQELDTSFKELNNPQKIHEQTMSNIAQAFDLVQTIKRTFKK